jgi:hypothetical protein
LRKAVFKRVCAWLIARMPHFDKLFLIRRKTIFLVEYFLSHSNRAWKNANVKTDNLDAFCRIVRHRRFHIETHSTLGENPMRPYVKTSMSNLCD